MASIVITPATFEAAKFHDPNITPGQDNAIGDVTDQNDRPYYISFAKELTENVHTAGNRAYCDIELNNEACEVLMALDRTSIGTVQSRSREWFGEEIPLEVVEQFYRSCVSKRRGRDSAFLRVKAGFQKQAAVIKVLENYEEEEEEEFAEDDIEGGDACEVSTLESYTGRYVEYVVQVRTIRFLKQTFCLEFVLSHIRVPRSKPAPLNLARMIIQTHETAEKRRQYEQKHAELLSLEKLKQEVEVEMENVLKRQKEVTDSYNAVFQEEQCLRAGADWLCTADESGGNDNSGAVIEDNDGAPHEPSDVEGCTDVEASEGGVVIEAGEGGVVNETDEGGTVIEEEGGAVITDTVSGSEAIVQNCATGEEEGSNETTKEENDSVATAFA